MAVFSVRHRRGLAEGRLLLELSERLRGRIWRVLLSENESWYETDETNWNYETDLLTELPAKLLDVSGRRDLNAGGQKVDLEHFVLRAPAAEVCDAIELFVRDKPVASAAFNALFEEEESGLRLLGVQLVKLDDGLLADLAEQAHGVLTQTGFDGAARELREAQDDLMDGDVRGAVHSAGSSFESVAKGLLGVTDRGGGELVTLLSKAGYFDSIPATDRAPFAKLVMTALPTIRNKLGGHGRGKEDWDLPAPYGRLAVHLAAAFNLFLLELATDRGDATVRESPPADAPTTSVDVSDFAPMDDDIPF